MQMRAALALLMCAAVLAAAGAQQFDAEALKRIGASVWSSGSWATRQVGHVNVSAERGVSGAAQSSANPREEMLPALLLHLTGDFRPRTARQRAN